MDNEYCFICYDKLLEHCYCTLSECNHVICKECLHKIILLSPCTPLCTFDRKAIISVQYSQPSLIGFSKNIYEVIEDVFDEWYRIIAQELYETFYDFIIKQESLNIEFISLSLRMPSFESIRKESPSNGEEMIKNYYELFCGTVKVIDIEWNHEVLQSFLKYFLLHSHSNSQKLSILHNINTLIHDSLMIHAFLSNIKGFIKKLGYGLNWKSTWMDLVKLNDTYSNFITFSKYIFMQLPGLEKVNNLNLESIKSCQLCFKSGPIVDVLHTDRCKHFICVSCASRFNVSSFKCVHKCKETFTQNYNSERMLCFNKYNKDMVINDINSFIKSIYVMYASLSLMYDGMRLEFNKAYGELENINNDIDTKIYMMLESFIDCSNDISRISVVEYFNPWEMCHKILSLDRSEESYTYLYDELGELLPYMDLNIVNNYKFISRDLVLICHSINEYFVNVSEEVTEDDIKNMLLMNSLKSMKNEKYIRSMITSFKTSANPVFEDSMGILIKSMLDLQKQILTPMIK